MPQSRGLSSIPQNSRGSTTLQLTVLGLQSKENSTSCPPRILGRERCYLILANTEIFYHGYTLNTHIKVFRQLGNPPYSSKDAPIPPFSNALQFISFGPLLMALRVHLWTVALKKSQNMIICELCLEKKFDIRSF